MTRGGRFTMYPDKRGGRLVQGKIRKIGSVAFEDRRKTLACLYELEMGRKPTSTSDGDVIEFLALGTRATERVFRAQWRKEKQDRGR